MSELVHIKGKDVYTDTFIIATGTQNEHESIKRLISTYKKKFKELGTLTISNRESSGGRPEQYYDLNEMQSTFLITLLRNNDIVVDFKLSLVKEFYRMRCFIMERQTAEWQQTRLQSKQIRLQETDAIKQLIEYAEAQGSTHAEKLYITYSKLVKQLSGYDKRDATDTDTLFMIIMFERTLFGIISSEMILDTPYKEIYQKAKQELTQLKLYWTRPALNSNSQPMLLNAASSIAGLRVISSRFVTAQSTAACLRRGGRLYQRHSLTARSILCQLSLFITAKKKQNFRKSIAGWL